jgi:hypothetical protein
VSVAVSAGATPQEWAGAALSQSGTCYWIHENSAAGTSYGSGATCTGTAALAANLPAFP